MRNRTRILIAAGMFAGLIALAGCAATESMWYDTGYPRTSAYVYTRPGTTVQYYDYSLRPPTYYYSAPYPYGYYDYGFSIRGGHERHEGFHRDGGRRR